MPPLAATDMSGLSEPSRATLSGRGLAITADVRTLPVSHSVGKAFRSYEPAIELFPSDLWSRVAGRVLRRAPRSLYGQGDARGYLPLRKAIAEYVGAARSVRCDAGQIIVTSGAQQGLDLVARLLLDPGDVAWMEDPGYPGAVLALRASGARILPVPVDDNGLVLDEAERLGPGARLAYVTPPINSRSELRCLPSTESRYSIGPRVRTPGLWKTNTMRNTVTPGVPFHPYRAWIELAA